MIRVVREITYEYATKEIADADMNLWHAVKDEVIVSLKGKRIESRIVKMEMQPDEG